MTLDWPLTTWRFSVLEFSVLYAMYAMTPQVLC